MKQCLTGQLPLLEVSGCLVEKPECGYAYKLGFSFVCRHPDHTKYQAHIVGALTKNEVHELYDELRQKRRDEFLANLDESSRKYFCTLTDFFGQPLSEMELMDFIKLPDNTGIPIPDSSGCHCCRRADRNNL